MSTSASLLSTPTVVAGHTLAHRVVMAPMTRARSTQPGDIPNAMNARYYSKGYADLVAFGRPFVANPDFARRLAEDLPLADFDASTLFGGDDRGYTDYPALPKADTPFEVSDAADVV